MIFIMVLSTSEFSHNCAILGMDQSDPWRQRICDLPPEAGHCKLEAENNVDETDLQ